MTKSYTLWIEERNWRQVTVTAEDEDDAWEIVNDKPYLYWAEGVEDGIPEYIVDDNVKESSDAR